MLALLTTPTGSLLRDLTPFVTACSFGTNKHGVTQIACELAIRGLRDAFDLYEARGSPHLALVENGMIIGEGRVEDRAIGDGTVSLTALGYQRALSDVPYTALWSTTSVAEWREVKPDESAQTAGNAPDRYTFDTQNRIFIAPKKNAVFGANTHVGEMVYQSPNRGTRKLIGIQFDVETNLATNWIVRLGTWSDGFASFTSVWTLAANGTTLTRSVHLTFTADDFVVFDIYNNTGVTHAGEDGANYAKFTSIRLVTSTTNRVNTTLTANISATGSQTATVGSTARMYVGQRLIIDSGNSGSESVVITAVNSSTQFTAVFASTHSSGQAVQAHVTSADEIARDIATAVNTLNSSQLLASTTRIASPGLDLTDESYEDQAIPDILNKLAQLGDTSNRRWQWGVEQGRVLRFDYETNGTRTWYVDALSLTLQGSIDSLANSRYALYKDAAGRTLRTAASDDAASIARFAITRRTSISASDTTSSATAGTIRDTALADTKNPQPRIGIDFDAVYDASGGRYPLWVIRGGDTIIVRNLNPAVSPAVDRIRSFIVDTTDYNAVERRITVTPASPLPTLDVLLARQSEGVS